jgi:hypothetical protein
MAESYTAQVINGVIVLDEGAPPLPEGTKVRVELVEMDDAVRDLSRRLLSVAGKAKGLPSDLAAQHDHYLHGQPKR